MDRAVNESTDEFSAEISTTRVFCFLSIELTSLTKDHSHYVMVLSLLPVQTAATSYQAGPEDHANASLRCAAVYHPLPAPRNAHEPRSVPSPPATAARAALYSLGLGGWVVRREAPAAPLQAADRSSHSSLQSCCGIRNVGSGDSCCDHFGMSRGLSYGTDPSAEPLLTHLEGRSACRPPTRYGCRV